MYYEEVSWDTFKPPRRDLKWIFVPIDLTSGVFKETIEGIISECWKQVAQQLQGQFMKEEPPKDAEAKPTT